MTSSFDRDHVDARLLAWLAVWSLTLSVAVAAMLSGASSMPDEAQVPLGIAMGGLVATWISIGTWAVLIDLPAQPELENTDLVHQQNRGLRIAVLLAWVANMIVFAIITRQEFGVVAHLLLVVAIGVMGPLITWQWTRQRIHRAHASPNIRRSIGHLLGIAVTIALGSAALKFGDRFGGFTSLAIVVTLSIAFLWLVMLAIMLSRWWGLMLVTLPIFAIELLAVGMMVRVPSRVAQAESTRLFALMCGFYFFALLFLLLMRSSGHRWLAARR